MKFFNNKKKQVKPKPRSMDELLKANAELKARAGEVQYLVYVYTKELEQVNSALLSLNQEAAERKKLDEESKPKEEPKNEQA